MMFVLMDIEWVENQAQDISSTQLAAMRVDEHWNSQDRFYSRIRPTDSSFYQWEHMAYTGGTGDDFLCAPGIYGVLSNLEDWLRDDDVLCFWHVAAQKIFRTVYYRVFHRTMSRRILILNRYLGPYLTQRKLKPDNPYILCQRCGLTAPGPKHQAERDVDALQMVLHALSYPAALLNLPPPNGKKPTHTYVTDALRPYQEETATGILHKTGCSHIPADAQLIGHPSLKYYFRKKPKICPHCMKGEVRRAIRARNQHILDRTPYQFIYSSRSDIFHRRDCPAVLSTVGQLLGSVYYQTCTATGRRPCRLCHPDSSSWLKTAKQNAAQRIAAKAASSQRSLTAQEQRSYDRYVEARTERLAAADGPFASETERNDFYTLTQPRLAFFCAAGYQAFHKRNCPKLGGLRGITGFARYKDAVRAGHTPCKLCKPTQKLDISCSIPITNQRRAGESASSLQSLCQGQGYPWELAEPYFCFSTPVGMWKIDLSSAPYVVYHINLIRTPGNDHCYHRQPRLFLSLADTFAYIKTHDQKLMDRSGHQRAEGE